MAALVETNAAPFFFGGPIPLFLASKYGYGFEEERRLLTGFLNERSPGRFGVFGGKASGKTSLVLFAAGKILVPRAHLDCGRTWPSTREAFYRNLCTALEVPPPTADDLTKRPLEAYANLPMPKKGTRGILVLENAHHLIDIDPDLINELPVLGARLPYHLVITGEAEPLRSLCPQNVELKAFSEATAQGFIERQFASVGILLDPDALGGFYEFTRGSPEALQRLGTLVWERLTSEKRTRVQAQDVDIGVADAVERLPSHTLAPWAAVRGIMRDIFIAMCLYDLESPTDVARRLQLEPKNVVVLLGRLETAHRLVDRVDRGRYQVADPLLKHYVRKEWSSPILR